MRVVIFCHSLASDWNHGNAHFLRGVARELLARFKLDAKRDDFAGSLSGGQRKLLEMARALMVEPELVMLDEPTTGLDPRSRIGMWDVIAGLVREGATLLLTTQYL